MKNPLENDENWLQQMRKPIFNLFIWKVDESYWLYGTMFCLPHLWDVFHIFGVISKHVFELKIKKKRYKVILRECLSFFKWF